MMRVLLTIVSPEEAICRTIEARQGQLVPETYRRPDHDAFGGTKFQLTAISAVAPITPDQLLDHVEARLEPDTCGVAIVSDRRLGLAARPLSDIYFMNEFDQHGPVKSPQNMLAALLNRVLRDYGHLTIRFRDGQYQKILRLPLRNFAAAEVDQLRDTCTCSTNQQGFQRRIDTVLRAFRNRQHPKRKSNYEAEYLIDDREKHFRLGHERHAQADTGPPHTRLCRLSNLYRFGRSFDDTQHYNVSMDGARMNGDYPDCHGEVRSGSGRTHLNMFTNDFF